VQANGTAGQASAALNGAPAALGLLDDLRGRHAVVTGAARGIGEAIAKWLIMAGADVTVLDRDSRVKDVFRTEHCEVMEADLDDEDVVALADELTSQRPVELLVNNVGITTPHRFGQIGAAGTSAEGRLQAVRQRVRARSRRAVRSPASLPFCW
jgi:NAD(P)-dependent dehydrogenase (short-subunit alcohol dehydrogenase family)